MIRTPSKKVAFLSTRKAFQYDMPVRERFDPTGYVQGTFDIEELEETKETSKTLMGTHASAQVQVRAMTAGNTCRFTQGPASGREGRDISLRPGES